MKLSVVIPCLNAAETLAQQLTALQQNDWPDWEVIIADNGSTDGTQGIALGFADTLNLRVTDASQHAGAGYARNVGATQTTGDALLFIDADDEVDPNWLEHMGHALMQHEFVAAQLEYHKLNKDWVYHSRGRPQEKELARHRHGESLPYAFSASLGIKRDLHDAINGFDTRFEIGEDMDYCWRAQAQGVSLEFVHDAVIHYRFRDTFAGIYRQARQYAQSNVHLYKHYHKLHRGGEVPVVPPKPTLSLKQIAYLLLRYPRIQDNKERGSWMWNLGWQMGILQGAWRYRVMPF
ncbi:MAG: glycosyltransferase family A protein [Deinococcota bacterium]